MNSRQADHLRVLVWLGSAGIVAWFAAGSAFAFRNSVQVVVFNLIFGLLITLCFGIAVSRSKKMSWAIGGLMLGILVSLGAIFAFVLSIRREPETFRATFQPNRALSVDLDAGLVHFGTDEYSLRKRDTAGEYVIYDVYFGQRRKGSVVGLPDGGGYRGELDFIVRALNQTLDAGAP